MTSFLIDVNVWLSLSWARHPHSPRAVAWFATLPKTQVRLLFCRVTELGILRLLTNTAVMGDSVLDLGAAFELLDTWKRDPRVHFASEPAGVEAVFRNALTALAGKSATKVIVDAYLTAFANQSTARLVTFDRAMSQLARHTRTDCLLLPSK